MKNAFIALAFSMMALSANASGGSDIGSHSIVIQPNASHLIINATVSVGGCSGKEGFNIRTDSNEAGDVISVSMLNVGRKSEARVLFDAGAVLTNIQQKLELSTGNKLPLSIAQEFETAYLEPKPICANMGFYKQTTVIPVPKGMTGKTITVKAEDDSSISVEQVQKL